MKRYGILSETWQPTESIDVYATEKKYWQSLWYSPEQLFSTNQK
jgi:hypothetical protein